jgi:hypothetical protein
VLAISGAARLNIEDVLRLVRDVILHEREAAAAAAAP